MQEKDRTGCGSIHLDQVAEIFRMYEVRPSWEAGSRTITELSIMINIFYIHVIHVDIKIINIIFKTFFFTSTVIPETEVKIE